jgi:hypothetical protein
MPVASGIVKPISPPDLDEFCMSITNFCTTCTFGTISNILDDLEPIVLIVQEVPIALWKLLKLPIHTMPQFLDRTLADKEIETGHHCPPWNRWLYRLTDSYGCSRRELIG